MSCHANFSQNGIRLLESFEGCRLEAYPDPGTGGDPWTIGRGSTRGVYPGMKITQDQADQRFAEDRQAFCTELAPLLPAGLNDDQFSAAVCFAYNVKSWKSTPWFAHLSSGDFEGAKAHWLLYDKAAGVIEPGLEERRRAELALFSGDSATFERIMASRAA